MAKYEVIQRFTDLQDGKKLYSVGDPFPRLGIKKVDEKRLQELSTSNNNQKRAVIKELKTEVKKATK